MDYVNIVSQFIQEKFQHKPDTTPLNYSIIIVGIMILSILYAEFTSTIFGIIYPLTYGLQLFNENKIQTEQMMRLNKYWIIYGMISISGFILDRIPFYYHLKMIGIYLLVNNDFQYTNYVFEIVANYYQKIRCAVIDYQVERQIEYCMMLVKNFNKK